MYVSPELVCIIGVAEDAEQALAVSQMWGGVIPSVWYVWGNDAAAASQVGRVTTVVNTREALSWTRGLEFALAELRLRYRCHYVFTHTDDAVFAVRMTSQFAGSSVASVLTAHLTDFRPLLAGFADDAVLAKAPGAAAVYRAHAEDAVGPLVAFDPGLLVFHHAVVDLFLPYYAPRGDSSQYGNSTLAGAFLHMFGPAVLREQAIVINDLEYRRRRTTGAAAATAHFRDRVERDVVRPQDAAWQASEDALNERLEIFLSRGLRRPYSHWGRRLEAADVTWDVAVGPQQLPTGWLLDRLVAHYDLRHEAVSTYMAAHATALGGPGAVAAADLLLERIRIVPMHLTIYVVVKEARDAFSTLWDALTSQDMPTRAQAGPFTVTVHVVVRPWTRRGPDRRLARLNSLHCPYANVTVTVLDDAVDADPAMLLTLWTPTSIDEFAVFLDDYVHVSPYLLSTALTAMRAAFYGPARPRGLWGIALTPPAVGDVYHASNFPPVKQHHPRHGSPSAADEPPLLLLLQYPPAMGTIFWADTWFSLRAWAAAKHAAPPLLASAAMNWLQSGPRMLQRYIARFAAERGNTVLAWVLPSQSAVAVEVPRAPTAASAAAGAAGSTSAPTTTTTTSASVPALLVDADEAGRLAQHLSTATMRDVQMLDTYFQTNLVNKRLDVALLPPLRQDTAAEACSVVVHHNSLADADLRRVLVALREPPARAPVAIVWRRKDHITQSAAGGAAGGGGGAAAAAAGGGGGGDEGGMLAQRMVEGFLIDDSTGLVVDDQQQQDEEMAEEDGSPARPAGDLAALVGAAQLLDPLDHRDDHTLLQALRQTTRSSCVAIVDTSSAGGSPGVSRALLAFAMTLTQTQFQNELIGLRRGGLVHGASDDTSTGVTDVLTTASSAAVSVVSGQQAVFPVSMLDHLIDLTSKVHDDSKAAARGDADADDDLRFIWRRCRGPLLSVVAADRTGAGPVVIDDRTYVDTDDEGGADARGPGATRCLAASHRLMNIQPGSTPLRYTTSVFRPPAEPPTLIGLAPVYVHRWQAQL